MTRYAVDEERGSLIASWSTGTGDVAITIAELPPSAAGDEALHLASAASRLSEQLWRCYTHPASAADSLEPNTEGWRRQGSRDAFAGVVAAVRQPNLPSDGTLMVSYDPVEESAHRLGRALHAIGDEGLTARVAEDVQAELDAVEQAECGSLSGRGRQAVVLAREDASPVQVAAADQILDDDPLDAERLFVEVDPTAAAVAAAHWLRAAAQVASEQSGVDTTEVVMEADNIEALPHESPTLVLKALDAGATPRAVVTGLVRDAMAVAGGKIPSLDALMAKVQEAKRLAASHPDDPTLRAALLSAVRPTPLDPARPALDLLEDLLLGIRGCWLIFSEYAALGEDGDRGAPDLADGDEQPSADLDESDLGGDEDLEDEFAELVRMAAGEDRGQLP